MEEVQNAGTFPDIKKVSVAACCMSASHGPQWLFMTQRWNDGDENDQMHEWWYSQNKDRYSIELHR